MLKKLLVLMSVFILPLAELEASKLDNVLAGEHRTKSSTRDGSRHPKATLEFFQISSDQKVLEITPGGGWYTEILAPYMRDSGLLAVGQYDANNPNNYYKKSINKFNKKMAANPELYSQVEVVTFHVPGVYQLGEDGRFDRVVTFRNLHNWMRNGDDEMKKVFAAFYKALKPGGKLGVLDHRLPEDRAKNGKGGYVKQSYAISIAESVGFKLEASSEINANAKDTADHEKGVWSLPPSYTLGDKDRAKYEAIGESDRMTLLFVKPE